jgi:hypothetical protein
MDIVIDDHLLRARVQGTLTAGVYELRGEDGQIYTTEAFRRRLQDRLEHPRESSGASTTVTSTMPAAEPRLSGCPSRNRSPRHCSWRRARDRPSCRPGVRQPAARPRAGGCSPRRRPARPAPPELRRQGPRPSWTDSRSGRRDPPHRRRRVSGDRDHVHHGPPVAPGSDGNTRVGRYGPSARTGQTVQFGPEDTTHGVGVEVGNLPR